MSVDRDLLVAAGRIGARVAISALDGVLAEAGAIVESAATTVGVEAKRRVARARERLSKMKRRERQQDVDDDGNPFGI